MPNYDVIILGAGPAGLAAAVYSARYNLKTLVFDMGYGRSTWFQKYSNYIGFPEGIPALDLREQGKRQAEKLGVGFRSEEPVKKISGRAGDFTVASEKTKVSAKAVIICTGVEDVFPQFDGFESYAGRSMYWCILCDGHYVNGQRVLCVTNQDDGVDMTLRLRQFTTKLTFLAEDLSRIGKSELAKLRRESIPILEGKIVKVEAKAKGIFKAVTVAKADGTETRLPVDALFHRLGIEPYNDVAKQLKLDLDERGLVKVDPETQETSRRGVYAAGDAATGHFHQVHAATYTGSRAAIAAYRALYERSFPIR